MNTCDRSSANPRTTWKTFAFVTLCLLALPVAAMGQSAPDIAEPGSIEAIAAATTDPSFVSPWVAYVPEAAGVPSPTDYLGRIAGAPGELTRPEEIFGYLRALAEASPRVHLEEIGRTLEGREILLVAIADEEGIASLDRLKAATAALADPRRTDPQQAEEIIATARPFYYINAGLHADETGPPEAVMELAYRLAVSDQPMIRRIREELVVLINPVSNPDGRAKMADWFYRYLEGRTDFAELPRQSPPYWGRYVFVDMNRDAHQQTQRETQAIYRMFWDYHPAVIHDLHESFALLQTWNGTGPYNPNIDPIVTSEFLEMSFHEVTRMTSLGMPGVWTWDFGDGFGHHYADSVAMNHNAIGRGYETFGNATGETVERVLEPHEMTKTWYRPWPPSNPLVWSMRDSVNYTETGLLAILDYAAGNSSANAAGFLPHRAQVVAGRASPATPTPLSSARTSPTGGASPRWSTCCGCRASRSPRRRPASPPKRAPSPPAPLSSVSTSPTATTQSTCCRRRTSSSPPASCPTTTCRGPCRCTSASRPSASTTRGCSRWPSIR